MSENWLIFIDTNILLDFYRLRGASAVKQLTILEENKDRLILTEQVEMEYLKHRQRVAAKALNELKKPAEQKFPAFLDEYQSSQMMKKGIADAVKQYKKVQDKIEKIILHPARNDRVYQSLSRVFKHKSQYSLARDTPEKLRIRGLARKRFVLGYPPRKKDDHTMGDALNWGWIVHCARTCPEKSNVVIVSRDGDYGIQRGRNHVLNDWLRREFQERVGRQRKIQLTDLLTHAFRRIQIPVSKEDEQEEREISRETKISFFDVPTFEFKDEGARTIVANLPLIQKALRDLLNSDPRFGAHRNAAMNLEKQRSSDNPDDPQ